VATAGLRDAPADDRARFLADAEALGVPIEVISGEEEAALTTLAVRRSLPEVGDDLVVVDVGGRSTELVRVHAGEITERTSVSLGSVKLTEGWLRGDPPSADEVAAARQEARRALGPLAGAEGPVVGAGGTPTTLYAVMHGIDPYDPDRVHGGRVTAPELADAVERLSAMTHAERLEVPGLVAGRADIALAGAVIFEECLRALGVQSALVSDRGVRWGVVYRLLEQGVGGPG